MSHMSAQQPGSSAHPVPKEHARNIACVICQANYAPSQRHEHLLLSPAALESAFMGMCHFCFRCRRPACPECWDDVHGLCASCGSEGQLPFRRPAAPLSSLLFTASRQAQLEREAPGLVAPLICIVPGRFRRSFIEQSTTASIPAIVQGAIKKMEREERAPAAPLGEKNGHARGFKRAVFTVLSLVLVVIIALVAAAYMSGDINIFIAGTLHVDIRVEIAYLWQLITHLF